MPPYPVIITVQASLPNSNNLLYKQEAMATSFVLDSRIPVDPNSNPSDPSHPSNVMMKTLALQKQANADTKYDPPPPARIPEPFTDSGLGSPTHYIIFSVIAALILIGMAIRCTSFYLKLLCAVGALVCLHYAVGKMEK